MNFIDIITLLVIGYGVYKGFKNGAILEVAGLLGLVIGIWAGMRLAFIFANYYRDTFELPENWIPLLAFLTAFLLGLGIVYFIGRAATTMFKVVQLNLVNRVAGAIFGALKWAFLFGTLLSMVGNSQVIGEETREGSLTYPALNTYVTGVQEYSIGLIPAAHNVFDDMENYFVDLDSVRRSNRQSAPEPEPNTPE